MKTFVTGGTGFVGSHVVELLLRAGHSVTCLVRNPAKAAAVFGDRKPRLVTGTLDDEPALRLGIEGTEVVFHVAGAVLARSKAEFFAINEDATKRLLGILPSAVRRFVYVSSQAAAGPTTRGTQLQGGEREHPVTHYGASKLAGELAVRAASVPWTVVRPPSVYGPRDVEFLRLFRMARRGLVPVLGDGTQELSFVYVEDLARALLAAATSRETRNRVYYACHPDVVRQRAFVAAVGRAVRPDGPAPRIVAIPAPLARAALWVTGAAAALARRPTMLSADKANEFLADAWTCSPAALIRDTHWTPNYDLAAGLAKTVAWYRTHRWL